jgi:hypothetical protein
MSQTDTLKILNDNVEFYQQLIESQQNYYSSTLTIIAIISAFVIALITVWGFVASKQQIKYIAKKIIKKEVKKNEELIKAKTYLIFSDIFYKNKEYDAAFSLQLLSMILFLKNGALKSSYKAIEPFEQRALTGINIINVKRYLNYFDYDYRDISLDLLQYDKNGLIQQRIFGTLKNIIEQLK